MKTFLITGASGFLGRHLVRELLEDESVEVIAIGGRNKMKSNVIPCSPKLRFYHLDAFFTEELGHIDAIVNCAFPRSNDSEQLASALDFTERLIHRIEDLKVESVINISSQGVYKRLERGHLSKEDSPISPMDLYSMVKYSTEKMFLLSAIPYAINVRLASIMMPQRFLYFFVNKVISGEGFVLTSPNQYAALLDVRDAAKGLSAILKMKPEDRHATYNLGINRQYSLEEYADSVIKIGKSLGYTASYEIKDNGTILCAGMDCSRIMNDTGWNPTYLKDEMVKDLFERLV